MHSPLQELYEKPELELLLRGARTHLEPASAQRIDSLLRGEIDWPTMIDTALRHGVFPLLAQHLGRLGAAPPPPVAEDLNRLRKECAWRSLWLTGALREILDEAEARGIRVVPYKGPVLAAGLYGDVSLRQFSDLDILVRRVDIPALGAALGDLGYRSKPASNSRRSDRERAHEFAFVHDESEALVELHCEALPHHFGLPLDLGEILDRARPVTLIGRKVDALTPEDLVLILSLHGFKHLWERLLWICDLSQILFRDEVDWPTLWDQVDRVGAQRQVCLALAVAHRILEAPVPQEALKRIQSDTWIGEVTEQIAIRLFPASHSGIEFFEKARFQLTLMARQKRFRFVRWVLNDKWTPRKADLASPRLPRGLSFLHYGLRAARMYRAFGVSPFRHLMRGLLGS